MIRQRKQTKTISYNIATRNLAIGSLQLILLINRIDGISLRTTTRITGKSAADVQQFLSTPSNWPDIVLSSWSVEGSGFISGNHRPMKVGDTVDEIFGLPPILPLSVSWTCVDDQPGRFDVCAPKGLPGIASNCRMLFEITPSKEHDDDEAVQVDLTMEYEPESVLAQLAVPILAIDNAIALKVLLPIALERHPNNPLNDFRKLMGGLYGIAGVAHFVDCLAGPSTLLIMAGSPPFTKLPWQGQLLALWWCATGPLAFGLSRTRFADLGLVVYGVTEVTCAAIACITSGGRMDALGNAVLVQAIVAASWLFSSRRGMQQTKK